MADTGAGYVSSVTETQFWARVGRELAAIRLRAGYEKTYTAYRAGAPATATLNDIEEGRIGNIDSLSAYCATLKVSLLDVLRVALDEDDEDYRLSADAQWVGRMFQEGRDEDARKGMLALARSQAAQLAADSVESPAVPPAARATSGGSRRPVRTRREQR